jgi:hypothetical protein
MNLKYVQERINELQNGLMNISDLPDNHPRINSGEDDFIRGQIKVWREVQLSLLKVEA